MQVVPSPSTTYPVCCCEPLSNLVLIVVSNQWHNNCQWCGLHLSIIKCRAGLNKRAVSLARLLPQVSPIKFVNDKPEFFLQLQIKSLSANSLNGKYSDDINMRNQTIITVTIIVSYKHTFIWPIPCLIIYTVDFNAFPKVTCQTSNTTQWHQSLSFWHPSQILPWSVQCYLISDVKQE